MSKLFFRLLPIVTLLAASGAAHAQQAALLGAWQCQTPQGSATLSFDSTDQLTYSGEATQYMVQGNVITALVNGLPTQYRYQVSGNQLAIANPDGSRTSCQLSSAGFAQDNPGMSAGGAMNAALQGTMCGWRGGSTGTGSYSATTRVTFDGRGRFGSGSESSFSGVAGQGYGSGAGNGGSYSVTSVQVGAPIHVRWNIGEADQAVVHNVSGGRITEIRYGKQVFGHALCGY